MLAAYIWNWIIFSVSSNGTALKPEKGCRDKHKHEDEGQTEDGSVMVDRTHLWHPHVKCNEAGCRVILWGAARWVGNMTISESKAKGKLEVDAPPYSTWRVPELHGIPDCLLFRFHGAPRPHPMHRIKGVAELLVHLANHKAAAGMNFSAEFMLEDILASGHTNSDSTRYSTTHVYAFPNMETGRKLMSVVLSIAHANMRSPWRILRCEEGSAWSPRHSLPLRRKRVMASACQNV